MARLSVVLVILIFVLSCGDADENIHGDPVELITDVHLVFTNRNNTDESFVVRAEDPDLLGIQDVRAIDEINLGLDKTYTLRLELFDNQMEPGEGLAAEIAEEGIEHQFFFSYTQDAFANPGGTGNIDDNDVLINYNDRDDNGNPLGLSTTWTTSSEVLLNGTFVIRLQVIPDLKTAETKATDGDTELEVSFVLNIQ